MGFFKRLFGSYSDRELRRIEPIGKEIDALEPTYQAMSDQELQKQTELFRQRLAKGETLDDILPQAFAVVREASVRVLGQRPFYVQLLGGIILHQGRIAEMKTGEGKTLTATLAAYLNALSGKGVHIVTVNDYLAKYQSEWMGKLFNFLGLSVGLVLHGMKSDERRAAYAADITYGTNNEFGFDYLRDNMVIYKEQKVQREHNFVIVDEVDSILIDEARTPLIISGRGDDATDLYERVNQFARHLKPYVIEETDTKVDQDSISDGDYIVDEKARTATLTQTGVEKAERAFQVENLMDPENMTLSHHINQAIKAYGIMHRDVDYVVKDGQVIIVDESTGRLMMGRRYSEGLHQAIEAKEGVVVEQESKTLATITFQNYFRMYHKLSGMTGTALTEEDEFREIYQLDVIVVPTNRPVVRDDHSDVVFIDVNAKYRAVFDEIERAHKTGQPILVGTVSIEKSELLARMLKQRGIPHVVLNAKHHEQEAEIVAQAGKLGAITIATNMAGRGTDIILGGNSNFLAKAKLEKEGYPEELIVEADAHGETDDEEVLSIRKRYNELEDKFNAEIAIEADKVRSAGGLYVIGTERHEARRIDNQLRGRSGRQGDPGESRFYLSLEDDVIRLFGGERMQGIMDSFMGVGGMDEDTPIESPILSNVIEGAQRKMEARNFSIRKSVLEFDDVMNRQREIIYSQRAQVLDGEDMSEYVKGMMNSLIEDTVHTYLPDDQVQVEAHHLMSIRDFFNGWVLMGDELSYEGTEPASLDRNTIIQDIKDIAFARYDRREKMMGSDVMRELERNKLLEQVDTKWMDHIDAMDHLKQGIYLRSYGQRDPVIEYRLEGFEMFDQMVHEIQEDTVRLVLTIPVYAERPVQRIQVAMPLMAGHGAAPGAVPGAATKEDTAPEPVRVTERVGRNEPCPCGSGKKYKQCHGR